jgi:hypothetical protein
MTTLKHALASLRMAIVLALFLSGLAIAATAGAASASTPTGHTIAGARTLAVPHSASGGGGRIDFWKVRLNGGADVQFTVPATGGNYYAFALFAPSTTATSTCWRLIRARSSSRCARTPATARRWTMAAGPTR